MVTTPTVPRRSAARRLGHHRRRARAGAAAHPRDDEDHVRPADHRLRWSNDSSADARPIAGLPRRAVARTRPAAAQPERGWAPGRVERLDVGVDRPVLDRVEVALPELDHPVHRVAAAAAPTPTTHAGREDVRRRGAARRELRRAPGRARTDLVGRRRRRGRHESWPERALSELRAPRAEMRVGAQMPSAKRPDTRTCDRQQRGVAAPRCRDAAQFGRAA